MSHETRNPVCSNTTNPIAARLDLRWADGDLCPRMTKNVRGVLVRGSPQAVGVMWGACFSGVGMACMCPSAEREGHCQ